MVEKSKGHCWGSGQSLFLISHIHACCGWVDEIKYGLIAAGSGVFTCWSNFTPQKNMVNCHKSEDVYDMLDGQNIRRENSRFELGFTS